MTPVALITGGASGIGAAAARQLAGYATHDSLDDGDPDGWRC